ncbi:MAG TPA: Hsp20/alpha crystallin family protein [Polyangiaceae bacterium]|nr:Hsp20/alpha crystallin family protein [Polyangiaceae bacterium]
MTTQQEQAQPTEQETERTEQAIERGPTTGAPARRGGYGGAPFSLFRRLSDDIDRLFGAFFGQNFRWPERLTSPRGLMETTSWPEVEVRHAANKFLVQVDVPGLKKEDITVEVRDNELYISGERKSETEQVEGAYYRTERTYGSFCRVIPLPQGAQPDTASASFENGVLKIEMEAPGGAQAQARRIEIREGSTH